MEAGRVGRMETALGAQQTREGAMTLLDMKLNRVHSLDQRGLNTSMLAALASRPGERCLRIARHPFRSGSGRSAGQVAGPSKLPIHSDRIVLGLSLRMRIANHISRQDRRTGLASQCPSPRRSAPERRLPPCLSRRECQKSSGRSVATGRC
jgi:hypothetical protein